jgi:hypothetical protein
MRNLTLAVIFALLVGVSSQKLTAQAARPAPDVLIFTNGDQLTGTLQRAQGGNIVFKSDMAGEVTVPADKVKELHVKGSFAVVPKNFNLKKGSAPVGSLEVAGGKVVVESAGHPEQTVAVPDVNFILDQKTYEHDVARSPGFFGGWNGTVNGGATIVRSSNDGSTFNAGIALVRLVPVVTFLPKRDRTTADFQETYGTLTQVEPTPAPEVKTSILHADAERDEYISPRFYALDLQSVFGGGFGWTPVQTPKQQLDLKVDVHYEKQTFSTPASNLNLIGSTFAEAYKRTLPRKMLFTETLSILPAWNDFSAYSANIGAGLAAPVFHRLSLNVSTTDNFLNDPAVGYKKNSYQFVTGVSYSLH